MTALPAPRGARREELVVAAAEDLGAYTLLRLRGGDLDPGRLRATVDATSTDGLIARFEADAPVVTSADPIRIALAPERRGRATWSVRGPAESLWAAARLQDQTLSGQLDGEGELSFGAGHLSGAGHLEIVDGRFEDKLTGVTLVDLEGKLREIYRDRVNKTLYIAGAGTLRYGEIIAVIDASKGAGVNRVGIITDGMRRDRATRRGMP